MAAEPLVCPSCHTAHPSEERFCRECGMPLIHRDRSGVDADVGERRERARKVKPQYSEGALVKVAGSRHQAEAELIQGLLLEEGVPSLLRRSRGFDVPDMLAAGPRDVLVPESGAAVAREVLLQAELLPSDAAAFADVTAPRRVLVVLLAMVAVVGLVAWLGTELLV